MAYLWFVLNIFLEPLWLPSCQLKDCLHTCDDQLQLWLWVGAGVFSDFRFIPGAAIRWKEKPG